MHLRRRRSKPAQAAALVGDYAGKASKTAGETAKTVVAYTGSKGLVTRVSLVAGAVVGIAGAVFGVRALRGGGGEPATG
jgi:hypothetical protein